MESFSNVVQPALEDVLQKEHHLKGKWNKNFFKNSNPIVLELGCGKGEYTVGMAERFPDKNFLGVDIKGARMWRGAKDSNEKGLANVGFLRTRIELIESFFAVDEIDEIWITFPDPQIKKRRNKKRLTGAHFINMYSHFITPYGLIHLKTDSRELFDYTNSLLRYNGINPEVSTDDLYSGVIDSDLLMIRTHYEQLFLDEGKKITYTRFKAMQGVILSEPPQ